ncbi:FAD binding domain-containing protein [Mycena galericulata]|nr:FAD binding domain-containing protein [Mycena galericulata]
MNINTNPKILIAGAGPSGLVLALALRRNGIAVRIIEKSPTPGPGQRGPGIMPRTLELLQALGVFAEFKEYAIETPPVRTYALPEGIVPIHTFDMAPKLDPTPSCPHLSPLCIGQNHLESVLREALRKTSCEVEFGSELVSLAQDADGVDATIINKNGQEEVQRYDFLVGADGARGVVRKQLGLAFLGESRPSVNFIIGDVRLEGLEGYYWHMWGVMQGDFVYLRPTETPGLFALMMASSKNNYEALKQDPDAIQKAINDITGRKDLKLLELVWASHWKANMRMVDNFRAGRCFVAGDAAHVHSPTGGQGLNSGVQDSFNLAWKLALVQRSLAPMAVLESYNEERLPVIALMLSKTTSLLNRNLTATEKDDDVSYWDRGGELLMLGVNYRWSSIVIDERDGENAMKVPKDPYGAQSRDLRAGDRAPDAPALKDIHNGQIDIHLFDVFDSSRHTVLVFSDSPERFSSALQVLSRLPQDSIRCVAIIPSGSVSADMQGLDLTLEDSLGHAYSIYDFKGECDIAVVRPDGVLGAVVRSSEALQRYFGKIFV